jgi:hypothetical protein
MSSSDLQMIARAGGNIIVDAKPFMASDLYLVAAAGKQSGSTLTILGAGKFLASDCQMIARANPGRVTFNFC